MATDYTPGDPPVPVGTTVYYEGSLNHGPYVVEEHFPDITLHPDRLRYDIPVEELEKAYPDGVGYHLRPADMPKKLDVATVRWARRTSFRIIGEGEKK